MDNILILYIFKRRKGGKKEMDKKSMKKIFIIMLLLIVTIAAIIFATYAWAKYTTTVTGSTTAQAAKWEVELTANNQSFVGTYSHVIEGKIAPGTSGSFDVTINPKGTEVDLDYAIALNSVLNKPTNVTFYTDENKTKVIDLTGVVHDDLKGRLAHGSAAKTLTIYWDWPFETETEAKNITESTAMVNGMKELATLKRAIDNAAITDENTLAQDQAAFDACTTAAQYAAYAKTKGATNVDINNVIDTVEGENATAENAMKVNYTLTAVQVNPNETVNP